MSGSTANGRWGAPRDPHPTDGPEMSGVELTGWIRQVYELAVRTPTITRARLVAAAIPPAALTLATRELQARGLLRAGDAPDSWEVTTPAVPVAALAAPQDLHQVELLCTLQELHDATSSVMAGATREIRIMRDGSPRTAFEFGIDLSVHRQRLLGAGGHPVRSRTTYDTSVLQLPRADEVLRARGEAGEESRFIAGIPFSVVVADDMAAVIDLTSYDSSGRGSLLIRDRRFVLGLRALADSFWRLAAPITAAHKPEMDGRSRLILAVMATGATDATIAHQAGVSQRTVERTVRSLMEELGATTRFQAGVQAARRGWL